MADWNDLIRFVGPLVGSMASSDPGSRAGFMRGWQDAAESHQKELDRKTQQDQQRREVGANYLLKIGEHAQGFDDPVALEQFLSLADQAGAQAGYTKPGDLKGRFTVPASKLADKRLKELTDQLGQMESSGYDLDQLASGGAHVRLKDGTEVPVSTALDLTRRQPTDASGQRMALPGKTGNTEEERFIAKWATDRGKTVKGLTADEELTARKAFREAGRGPGGSMDERAAALLSDIATAKAAGDTTTATAKQGEYDRLVQAKRDLNAAGRNPQLDDINLSLKQLQLENERRKAKESSATAADITPGSKEYKVAEDLASGRITFQQLRTLYSYSRDVNKKLAIYDKAAELNPQFSPAAFEMGFKFASSPKVQAQMASLNNVMSGVPDLLKASDAASRFGATALNQFVIPGGIAIGGRKYSDFKTAQIAFADELSGALGYGSATDMSREMGFNMANPNLSPANFRSAIETIVLPFVQRKKASLLGPMGPYGSPDLNPAAPNPSTTETDVIYARDKNGRLQKAKKGTPLPAGWKLEQP